MRALKQKFEDATFRYAQHVRQGHFAIFTQQHKDSGVCRYEVVRIRVKPLSVTPSGQEIPEREAYPTAKTWGVDGFTLFSLTAAQAKLAELERAQEEIAV